MGVLEVPSSAKNDFGKFTILSEYFQSETSSTKKSRKEDSPTWIKPGEKITLNNITINRGFFYIGSIQKAALRYRLEPSLIDDTLETINADMTYYDNSIIGQQLDYFSLSPPCRGAYINWLASDRSNTDTPLVYLVLYLYGIERRLLSDNSKGMVDDTECCELLQELIRLKAVFYWNFNFCYVLNSLIGIMLFYRPKVISLLEARNIPCDELLLTKHRFAKAAATQKPISPDLALFWLGNFSAFDLDRHIIKSTDLFRRLFRVRFVEKYKDSFIIRKGTNKLALSYSPANKSLNLVRVSDKKLFSSKTSVLPRDGIDCLSRIM